MLPKDGASPDGHGSDETCYSMGVEFIVACVQCECRIHLKQGLLNWVSNLNGSNLHCANTLLRCREELTEVRFFLDLPSLPSFNVDSSPAGVFFRKVEGKRSGIVGRARSAMFLEALSNPIRSANIDRCVNLVQNVYATFWDCFKAISA